MTDRTPSRHARGAGGEAIACRHLEHRGLTCLARNFRSRGGELDLVMDDGGTLVFVEVRLRSREDYGTAAESITAGKRRRVVRAARYYLHRHGAHQRPCRFDVVTVDADGKATWLRDAFRADD